MTKEKEVACIYCGRQLQIPSSIKNNLALETNEPDQLVCIQCAKAFAKDPESCFGKQTDAGKSLADDPACKECSSHKACKGWSKNPVKYKPKKEEVMAEKEKEAKATPPASKGKKGKKAATTTAATQPEPKTKKAGKAAKQPAVKKAETAKAPAGDYVEFAEGVRFRKGSSLEIACSILVKRKSIKQDEAIALLEKSGVESSNYPARIGAAAKLLKAAGVITAESTDKGIVYSATK